MERIAESDRITVEDTDAAPELLADAVIRGNKLFFDGSTPVVKMILHYQRISKNEAIAFICGHLDEKSQIIVPNRHIDEAYKRLQYMARLQIDLAAEFKEAQMYVNLSSGIYDILTQEIVPLRGKFKFDYVVDITYQPRSKLEDAPNFKNYVETSVGMEQYQCLIRTLGYALSSLTKARKCCVMLGRPKSGKSSILDLLESVLKGDLVSHESFDRMGTERAKSKYIGRRVNISREINTKPNKNADSFKSLISNECTTGEEKYEVQKSFIPTLFFIFAGNVDIEFAKECMDDAILDRLVYIIFNRTISEDEIDLDLEEKLKAEKDVIFSLALDSLKGLIEDKYDFKMAPISEEHIKHRRDMIHSAESFLDEKCRVSDSGKVSKVALYAAYVAFCKANALKPECRNTFYDKVRNYDSSITDGRAPDSTGNSVHAFNGISLIVRNHQVTDENTKRKNIIHIPGR